MADPRGNEDNPMDDNSLRDSDSGHRRLMKPPLRFTFVVAARSDPFKFPGNSQRIARIFVHSSDDNFTKLFRNDTMLFSRNF